MATIDTKQLESNLAYWFNFKREQVDVEHKGDIPWTDRKKKLEIIKSVFALANNPGGGVIIVGIDKNSKRVGLSKDKFDSFQHDSLNRELKNRIGSQDVQVDVEKRELPIQGIQKIKRFVFIVVQPTNEYPLIYSGKLEKNNEDEGDFTSNIFLRPGALYIRNKGPIENKEIATPKEWQSIIENTLRKYRTESDRRKSIEPKKTYTKSIARKYKPQKSRFDEELIIKK